MAESDGFQLVSGKKAGRRRKCPKPNTGPLDVSNSDHVYSNDDVEQMVARIAQCQKEVQESSFLDCLLSVLGEASVTGCEGPTNDATSCQNVASLVNNDNTSIPLHTGDSENMCRPNCPLEQLQNLSLEHNNKPQHVCSAGHFMVDELICYGIGNFTTCAIARYQLALCILLKEHLRTMSEKSLIYDPVLSPLESAVLSKMGFTVLTKNEEGKRRAMTPTLFFMPHCGKALYNNLLWANWHKLNLQHVAIIGNSFSHMTLCTPSRILKQEAAYVVRASSLFKEFAIQNTFVYSDIFNDLSLHVPVSSDKVDGVCASFWEDCDEPVYGDTATDIILGS